MSKKVRVVVEVQMNAKGDVKSVHRPFDTSDQAELERWPSGGLVQLAHAMFVEALRRESYTMAITAMSTGTPFSELTPKTIEELTRSHLIEMADKFASSAAKEAYDMICAQEEEAEDKPPPG
jgi:hypothetical protein